MCKYILLSVLMLKGLLCHAQSAEMEQLSLDLQKLAQLKSILGDMESNYVVLFQRYEAIRNDAKGNFLLHQAYLDGLLQVSPAVQEDPRLSLIAQDQATLTQACASALLQLQSDPRFSTAEVSGLSGVYEDILRGGTADLEELNLVLTAGALRMTDDERLLAIDRVHRRLAERLSYLRYVNHSLGQVSAGRAGAATDLLMLKNLYGL